MSEQDQRIMRIPLPVALIREMDSVITKGVGGYMTRSEFIVDAIQERVLELTVSIEVDAGAPAAVATQDLPNATGAPNEIEIAPKPEIADGLPVINAPSRGRAIEEAPEFAQPEGRALFGLHNRDFPSLWALSILAELTREAPVPPEVFFIEASARAWSLGERLLEIERRSGHKLTALFPTNSEKPKASEAGFRAFAIGNYQPASSTSFVTAGPLFEWQVAALVPGADSKPTVGVTAPGLDLLNILNGLSIEEPHKSPMSDEFFAHLSRYAPSDWRGFVEVVRAVGRGGATRNQVLDHFNQSWPEWSENEVSTNAAGYIARAREWGLVEPKQVKSTYKLTSLGLEHVEGATS